jgi:Txe/YoeB family toxin of toxin-antitoxin system
LSTEEWIVIPHRDVKRKDEVLLKNAGLYANFMAVVQTLKANPYSRNHRQETLNPKSKRIYSMRISAQHRCVYTIDKANHVVKIWSAWSHYENRMPK